MSVENTDFSPPATAVMFLLAIHPTASETGDFLSTGVKIRYFYSITLSIRRQTRFKEAGTKGNTFLLCLPLNIIFYTKLVDCLEKCLIYGHIRRFAN